jgi:hypothetical protein
MTLQMLADFYNIIEDVFCEIIFDKFIEKYALNLARLYLLQNFIISN